MILSILACAAIAACAIVYFHAPETTIWLPKCPFYTITGLQCPSCGSTRALYYLLHLKPAQAIICNPFIVVSWPLIIAAVYYMAKRRYTKLMIIARVYIVAFIAWWIVRNVVGV